MRDARSSSPTAAVVSWPCYSRCAASPNFAAFQQCLHLAHDLGVFEIEIYCLTGIGFEVVKLARSFRRGVRQRKGFQLSAIVVVPAGAAMIQKFPRAAADGERKADRLVQRVGARRSPALFAKQHGQQIETVLGGVGRQRDAGHGRAGRHDVGEADGLITHAAGGDFSRPAHDERHAVAALPLVALHTAPRPRAVVAVVGAHADDARGLRAVVAGKHDDGVVREPETLERLHQFADDVVELENEIAVRA